MEGLRDVCPSFFEHGSLRQTKGNMRGRGWARVAIFGRMGGSHERERKRLNRRELPRL